MPEVGVFFFYFFFFFFFMTYYHHFFSAEGGKIGLFGGAGVGKTVFIMELINNIAKVYNCA